MSEDKIDILLFTKSITKYYLRFSTKANVKYRNTSSIPQSIIQDPNRHFLKKNMQKYLIN